MNIEKVMKELKQKYPGKEIFQNDKIKPTEIICEIEPTTEHPEYSIAVAVIVRSILHYHKMTEEVYEIIKGELKLYVDGKLIILKTGEKYLIKPGMRHYALGQETWVKTTARPGWIANDHHLVSLGETYET